MGQHFTVTIEINQVTEAEDPKVDGYGKTTAGTPRKVAEVTRLVLRAPTIEALKKKVTAHVELVEGD